MVKQRLNLKSAFILPLILFCVQKGFAQFTLAEIGVNGLTCSACTRAVEMNIRKLDFVDSVAMNLENTEGKITFKAGKKVNIEKIAQAVFDAGFSVRYLKANFVFDNITISNGFNWTNDNEQYCFVKAENKVLNGERMLTFIGEKFMPSKKYKTWKIKIIECCGVVKKKIYYVTI